MANRKVMMDMRSKTEGISSLESKEQQRNWDKKSWQKKANDPLANYDPTRAHLNFEVTKGGVIQQIDKSKSIDQKMRENLASRGIANPNDNPNAKRKSRILAQFVIGGNSDRMREIAFGNQKLDLSKGADNSHLTRQKDIEEWAKDVYGFIAKRFGEENIVSCYVHLDEKAPHIHLTLLPVKDGKLSYRAVFGKNLTEESNTLTMLHTEIANDVGKKWGLERGSNMAETRARHRSTEEYKRELVNTVWELQNTKAGLEKQIHRAEIKLKSFTTMLDNLQSRKEDIQAEIDDIAKRFGEDGQDVEELAKRMTELNRQLASINEKIAERQQMLEATNAELTAARAKLEAMQHQHTRLQTTVSDDIDRKINETHNNILTTYNNMVASTMDSLMPTLTDEQHAILQESGFNDLTDKADEVVNCALLLALGYVHEATNYVESLGGGGSSARQLKRDKDDDDERWWMRCIAHSVAMLRTAPRRQNRKR